MRVGVIMKIEINNFVSIDDANQDFSRVARLVDEKGSAAILKNNIPRYIIMDISQFQQGVASDDEVYVVSKRILEENHHAYEILSK
jgi:antitoxin Phd